ncbi:MAG: hypothetical protein NTV51_02960, partial [Verrucomicrobia bacterium]|nr:hypothetical protein [Verrucomicrobiota bacterium]
ADPALAVFGSSGAQLASNDNWGESGNAADLRAAAVAAGAFALGEGSKDSALLLTLDPGTYTAQVSGTGAASGVSLLEIYEVP